MAVLKLKRTTARKRKFGRYFMAAGFILGLITGVLI